MASSTYQPIKRQTPTPNASLPNTERQPTEHRTPNTKHQHQTSTKKMTDRNNDILQPAAAPQFLHTMIRVLDLQKSIDFYVGMLGMKLLRRHDYEAGRFTLAFVGYENETDGTVIELTHNWDRTAPYVMGDGFGHLAIKCDDMVKFCDILKTKGVEIPRPPGPMGGRPDGTMLAFIKDPDGYLIELLARG